jgi:hypothetical protein
MGALPHGDGIHGGGENVALVATNSWFAVKFHPDSESGEFYVQNVCREISYNFIVEEFSV